MAIEFATYELLRSLNRRFPGAIGGNVAILGDCSFYLPGVAGDNAKGLARFVQDFGLNSAVTLDLYGKPTIRCDLHEPAAPELRDRFDLVLDAGTMSFCFNLPMVWQNILAMLKDAGYVFHLSSMTGYFGRAYYSLSPMLFRDFYAENGFDVLYMGVRSHRRTTWLARALDRLERLRGNPSDGYHEIDKDAIFLRCASPIGMEFSKQFAGHAQMIPNDATIVCLARRRHRREFRNVVASLYANG